MKLLYILFIAGITLPMSLMAQKNDSTATTVKQAEQSSSDDVVEKVLTEKIKDLENENKSLKAQVEQLNAHKVETAKSGETRIRQLADSLTHAKKLIDKKGNELNLQKATNDSLTKVLGSLDGVIYKECLLYPLSIRYNQQRINESLKALDAYCSIVDKNHQSSNLKQCIEVYKPFLEGGSSSPYLTYTNELITAFDEMSANLRSVGSNETMLRDMKKKCTGDIKGLKYYPFYKNRDISPYKSIEFLDNALDHLKLLINESRNVADDIDKLKKSLEPKL